MHKRSLQSNEMDDEPELQRGLDTHGDLTVIELANHPRSARICRRHVARTCTDWGCGHLTENAMAVSEELVSNALRHSSGALTYRLEYRHDALTVAVTDHTSALPIPADGYGLRIIAAFATDWGSTPTTTDGKTVWAVLR